MAELLLSTTGTASPVIIDDLGGRSFTHPVTNLDLLLEYSHSTIMGSTDLNTKVAAGEITLTDADGVAFLVVQDLAPIKNNFDAAAPTVNDDIDAGYSKDSLWVKSAAPIAIFVCLDNAVGAADWGQVTIGGPLILGSIPFSNGTQLIEDNDNLFWDATGERLGVGTTDPLEKFYAVGGDNFGGAFDEAQAARWSLTALSSVVSLQTLFTTPLIFGTDGVERLRIGTTGLIKLVSFAPKVLRTAINNNTGAMGISHKYAVSDTSAARTLTISSVDILDTDREFIIKDESGGAGTNNITIDTEGSETIDGAASVIITVDFGVVRLYSDGTNLFSF